MLLLREELHCGELKLEKIKCLEEFVFLLVLNVLILVTEKVKEPTVTEAVDKKEVKKAEPKKPEPKKAESAEEQTKAEEQKKPKAEEPVKNLTQWENSPSRCPVCGAKMSEKYCPVCRHRSGEETLLESKEGMKKFVKIFLHI